MGITNDEPFLIAVEAAPGPAPWYLGKTANNLASPSLELSWHQDAKAGPTLLKDGSGRIYAAVQIYTYISRLNQTQFLVWKSNRDKADKPTEVVMELYDLQQLKALSAAFGLFSKKLPDKHFVAASSPVASITIPATLAAGETLLPFPTPFHACAELFILVPEPNWQNPSLNLWIITPATGRIRVVPQTWFTNGSFDFGYQWVTRITRDPASGNLVGDGIRIGEFLLDPAGKTQLRWLRPTFNA